MLLHPEFFLRPFSKGMGLHFQKTSGGFVIAVFQADGLSDEGLLDGEQMGVQVETFWGNSAGGY